MIVILDYGMGNLQSVSRAFAKIGVQATISSNREVIELADKVVLPGVGSFSKGMENLEQDGLLPILNHKVMEQGTPVLGICLGFQMFTKHSDEGNVAGLGWINGRTTRISFDKPDPRLKIPHIGWNTLNLQNHCPLFVGIPSKACFYFAHSYCVSCEDDEVVAATTHYGDEFVTAVRKKNIFGTQFHPEKSHANGIAVLRNFLEYN